MMQLTLSKTRAIVRLGNELGRGGEGAVFAVDGQKDRVAKIYSIPPERIKIQKLLAMAEAATGSILKIAAWPIDLLSDSKGTVRGFMMPRVNARRDIHELYSPKSRSESFPEANFQFLIHVAANIARAFAVVHEQGHVIGDINHGNLLVGSDGTVMFIDCDSFQIRSAGNVFTCDVGVSLFTPPELQGLRFTRLIRTANHDRFGLAVLVFHILYMGRHPFAGRYSGSGEMPIEKAIAEYRFAYAPDRVNNSMDRPPGTIPLGAMGTAITQLFTQAFGHTRNNEARPDAKVWLDALEKLKSSLRTCPVANWHHYLGELPTCPWCGLEAQTGVRLFGQGLSDHTQVGVSDVAMLWRAISAISEPEQDPTLPSERRWFPPAGVKMPRKVVRVLRAIMSAGVLCAGLAACTVLSKNGGVFWALLSYLLASAVWPRVSSAEKAAVEQAYSEAKAEWQKILSRWKREASRDAFTGELKALEKARAEVLDLPNERRRRLAKLEGEREKRQRLRYLDRFRIGRANIHGVASGRTAMLASYGIETAGDIEREKIMRIPGFGSTLTSELVKWKQGHERNFRFNPNEPVDRRDIIAIDRELESIRQNRISSLREGPNSLKRLSQEIRAGRPRLLPMMESAWTALKIAEARRNALRF